MLFLKYKVDQIKNPINPIIAIYSHSPTWMRLSLSGKGFNSSIVKKISGYCKFIFKELAEDKLKYSGLRPRTYNERSKTGNRLSKKEIGPNRIINTKVELIAHVIFLWFM